MKFLGFHRINNSALINSLINLFLFRGSYSAGEKSITDEINSLHMCMQDIFTILSRALFKNILKNQRLLKCKFIS